MKRIAFIYNSVSDAKRRGMLVECAPRHTVTAIEHALVQGGYELIPINLHSRDQLEGIFGELGKPDFAFCIAEGFLAEPQTLFNGCGAAMVRQVLTELNVPFSHSSVAAMELCRYKDRTYHALQAHGVSCPWHLHLFAQDTLLDLDCRLFPLFVKPAGGGNSVGIDAGSVVNSQEQLARRILSLHHSLGPINLIVEKFLPGSEYTVGVIGNAKPVVLPPIAFANNLIRSSDVKRRENDNGPVHIISHKEPLYCQLRELALSTFLALGCSDAIRIDIMADSEGNLYVIDVNGTPSLAPSASLAQMAAAAGIDYTGFVNLLVYFGLERIGLGNPVPEQVTAAEEKLNALREQEPVVA